MKKNGLLTLALGGAAVAMLRQDQGHNLMRLPSFRGVAEVRASLPGRMRLYMPSIARDSQLAMRMKEALERTGVVREATLNFTTSTLLIHYDETRVEAAVVQGAAMKLMALDEAMRKSPISRVETGLDTLYESVNHAVLNATDGWLDVRTLAGCALTAAALKSFLTHGASGPGAMTLLWWASGLFGRNAHGTN